MPCQLVLANPDNYLIPVCKGFFFDAVRPVILLIELIPLITVYNAILPDNNRFMAKPIADDIFQRGMLFFRQREIQRFELFIFQ